MAKNSVENRSSRRFIAKFPIRFRVAGEPKTWKEAFVEDLSLHGLKIRIKKTGDKSIDSSLSNTSREKLSDPKPLQLEFAFTVDSATESNLLITGSVVWQKYTPLGEEYGIQLDKMGKEEQARFEQFIHSLGPKKVTLMREVDVTARWG